MLCKCAEADPQTTYIHSRAEKYIVFIENWFRFQGNNVLSAPSGQTTPGSASNSLSVGAAASATLAANKLGKRNIKSQVRATFINQSYYYHHSFY